MRRIRKMQLGVITVEFAIIAGTLMLVLFGVIEVARGLFVWNTIGEATRRGARVAAVCPVGHTAVQRVAVFGSGGGSDTKSPILSGLTTGDVDVDYLDDAGAETAVFKDIAYVRVSITGYTHTMLIPFIMPTLTVPPFTTTIPAESLGWIPELDTRQCFGTAS